MINGLMNNPRRRRGLRKELFMPRNYVADDADFIRQRIKELAETPIHTEDTGETSVNSGKKYAADDMDVIHKRIKELSEIRAKSLNPIPESELGDCYECKKNRTKCTGACDWYGC
jgi:hypothetical protein